MPLYKIISIANKDYKYMHSSNMNPQSIVAIIKKSSTPSTDLDLALDAAEFLIKYNLYDKLSLTDNKQVGELLAASLKKLEAEQPSDVDKSKVSKLKTVLSKLFIPKLFLAEGLLGSSVDLSPSSQDLINSTKTIKDICEARGLVFDSNLFNPGLPNTKLANNLCIFFSTKISDSVLKNLPSKIRASLAKVLLTAYDESKQNSLGETLRQIITSLSQNLSESTSMQDIRHSFLLLNHMDSAVSTILEEGKASGDIGSYIKKELDYLTAQWGSDATSNATGNRDFSIAIKAVIRARFKSKDPFERKAIKLALLEWIETNLPKMKAPNKQFYTQKLNDIIKSKKLFRGHSKFQTQLLNSIKLSSTTNNVIDAFQY